MKMLCAHDCKKNHQKVLSLCFFTAKATVRLFHVLMRNGSKKNFWPRRNTMKFSYTFSHLGHPNRAQDLCSHYYYITDWDVFAFPEIYCPFGKNKWVKDELKMSQISKKSVHYTCVSDWGGDRFRSGSSVYGLVDWNWSTSICIYLQTSKQVYWSIQGGWLFRKYVSARLQINIFLLKFIHVHILRSLPGGAVFVLAAI